MLTISWNTHGFDLIDAIPKGEKHGAPYFIDHILTPICRQLISTGDRRLFVHADNSQSHAAKVVLDPVSQKAVRFATHLPYSQEIVLSDSFLFDHLKPELLSSFFQAAEELLVGGEKC
jgi:hypothetical protein